MKHFPRLHMTRRSGLALAAAPLLAAAGAFAASEDGHREHDPHEHGHGALDIVLEGEDLVAELRIPAVNVIGFEHAPRDDAELETVRNAIARFSDAAAVLVPTADAECEIEDVEVEIAGTDHEGSWKVAAHGELEEGHEGEDHDADTHGKHEHEEEEHEAEGHAKREHEEEHEEEGHAKREHEEEHEEEGHAKHEHEEEHEEEGHAKHEHEEEHEEHAGESGMEAHSELHATYRFHCHAPERLARIDVRVFDLLHEAEEIGVRVVTVTAQTAMDLHPGETVVEISP